MIPLLVLMAMSKAPPPIATLRQLGPALVRCYKPPEHSEGMQLTVRLSLTSSGALIDKPHITFSHLLGKPEEPANIRRGGPRLPCRLHAGFINGELAMPSPGGQLTIRFIGGRSTAI